MSESAYDVVSFIALNFEHRNAVGPENILDDGHSETDGFGRLLALRLVEGECFVPERRSVRVEGHTDVGRLSLGDDLLQRVHETKDGRRVLTLRVDARVLDKGVISTIDERISVQ